MNEKSIWFGDRNLVFFLSNGTLGLYLGVYVFMLILTGVLPPMLFLSGQGLGYYGFPSVLGGNLSEYFIILNTVAGLTNIMQVVFLASSASYRKTQIVLTACLSFIVIAIPWVCHVNEDKQFEDYRAVLDYYLEMQESSYDKGFYQYEIDELQDLLEKAESFRR